MNPLVERLGWTLLHSLWQGVAVWIALEIALALLRQRSAHARHLVGCVALAVVMLAPFATFFCLDLGARLQSPAPAVPAAFAPAEAGRLSPREPTAPPVGTAPAARASRAPRIPPQCVDAAIA